MHIEPGVVDGAKMALAFATAAGAAGYMAKLAWQDIEDHGTSPLIVRSVIAAAGTFVFFEVMPHFPVGVSEVHVILGTTLLLLLGVAPAAIGLAAGLCIQGLFFAPTDLPMYFVNVTTLLMPLFAIFALAKRVIPQDTAYVDLSYGQALNLSLAYQGGVVAFWAIYGQGVGAETLSAVLSFCATYMLIILIKPVVDLGALALAKASKAHLDARHITHPRVFAA
ncbi:cobalt transporter [Jannaschia pagri]|uniref:Cobalt transporter n=1 Tax=Jannaschia pagri TaxID=2829797 RepID=A0ABQ4NI21_9RHOB|nr:MULTISPECIES: energy-coupling factor ABC transporter permease [unclassified Jannaschia]GIT89823.1 cobalt transporter [Jannaschia sp. AI_61]GIT94070.1 cobalt transporter [Jannaschia sp. AI_62]